MAHYTISIKTLKDNHFDFGLNDYPIFDETYRNVLNNNIINHYLMNEIGFETPALFKFYLNQTMNEIMPYYNELYKAQKEIIDSKLILNNLNIKETFNRTNDTLTNNKSESISQNKNLYQDTPAGELKNTDIDNAKWATDLTLGNIHDNSSNNGVANNTENYVKSLIGNNGNKYSIEVLKDIKNDLMNIDLMIIEELNNLFMGIY